MGYLGVSCFLLLKPFHMILFGPVPPDGEVSPDSHETETERQLQSKTEDRPGGAGGQGAASVASGFRGTSLALVTVSVWLTSVPGAGGQWTSPDSTVAHTCCHSALHASGGLVSACSQLCLCLQRCCRFSGNADRGCDCRYKCSECWELWMGDGDWVGVGFLSHMGRVARGGSLGRFK